MINSIFSLSRIQKQLLLVLIDSITIVLIAFASVSLRLEELHIYSVTEQGILRINWEFFITPLIALPIFFRFGLYRETIRYMGFKAMWSIIQAVTLYSLILGIMLYLFPIYGMPRSVVLINWMLSIMVIGGIRMTARWLITGSKRSKNKKNILIYGCGSAGRQLAIALSQSNE